ncbi:MAG: hypothetical protein JWP85_478 [Rhodoglobus sp.]|nr:hypothetical protein [Rhodoglobus sp.]
MRHADCSSPSPLSTAHAQYRAVPYPCCMTGRTWDEFRLEAFGEPYMVWHDGPDFYAFTQAWQVDPGGVEGMLREGLAQSDALAAESIGELPMPAESIAAFTPLLLATRDTSTGTFRVRVAQTLRKLTGSETWSSDIVDVLVGREHWGDRIDAAMALGHFTPTIELIAALMRGVLDEEYLVRYHSANSLLTFAGLPADVGSDKELFPQLSAENAPELWSLAASGLAGSASARLMAG